MPDARLLGGRLNRRFKKLENRSPLMATLATTRPDVQAKPSKGAVAVAATSESMIPRIVLDRPKTGRPSMNTNPPSSA